VKIAIMQPYLLPYLGYFALIRASDRFVSFDTAQYIRHGWVNRNRVLHPTSGWQYIGAPVAKHHRDDKIRDIVVADGGEWKSRLLRQLVHYKRVAPHFDAVMRLLEDALDARLQRLSEINLKALTAVCGYLDLRFDASTWSEAGIEISEVDHPGGWAPAIAHGLGAREYINPVGGQELFRPKDFSQRGLILRFLRMSEVSYDQRRSPFEPGLSIVDVLMFNSPAETLRLIDQHELVAAL
jgi:hypothetical protein